MGAQYAARLASPTLWVAGPKETQHVLKQLLERRGISTKRGTPAAWPPSTKKRSVFSQPKHQSSKEAEADWVRG